jgi:hypothetical protein
MKTKKYLILNISIVAICIMLISSCKGDLSKKVGGVFQSKYESKEGKFKIKFPKEPKVSSEKYPSAVGEISVNTFMHEETPNNIFTVVYADYPAGNRQTRARRLRLLFQLLLAHCARAHHE